MSEQPELSAEQVAILMEAREALRRHWLLASIRARCPYGIDTLPNDELEGVLAAQGGPLTPFEAWANQMQALAEAGSAPTEPADPRTPEEASKANAEGLAKIKMTAEVNKAPVEIRPVKPLMTAKEAQACDKRMLDAV